MRITDILNRGEMSLSYEVFPPKKETSLESVLEAAGEIAALKPSFMSVTYGAGGGTSEYTADICQDIQNNFGVPALAHLTCVSSDKNKINDVVENLKDKGINNILALIYDSPELFHDGIDEDIIDLLVEIRKYIESERK